VDIQRSRVAVAAIPAACAERTKPTLFERKSACLVARSGPRTPGRVPDAAAAGKSRRADRHRAVRDMLKRPSGRGRFAGSNSWSGSSDQRAGGAATRARLVFDPREEASNAGFASVNRMLGSGPALGRPGGRSRRSPPVRGGEGGACGSICRDEATGPSSRRAITGRARARRRRFAVGWAAVPTAQSRPAPDSRGAPSPPQRRRRTHRCAQNSCELVEAPARSAAQCDVIVGLTVPCCGRKTQTEAYKSG